MGVIQLASLVGYTTVGRPNQDSTLTRGSGGWWYGYSFSNNADEPRYVYMYDINREPNANDTPSLSYTIAPGQTEKEMFASTVTWDPVHKAYISTAVGFTIGIGFRVTTSPNYRDEATCAPNDVFVNLYQGPLI